MAKYSIVKFKNMSPLHVGAGRDTYDTAAQFLQSDTVSAALASIYAQQGGDDVLGFMNGFTVSSAFPYSGGKYFLPKPLGRLQVAGCDVDRVRKMVKKVRYVDLEIWQELVAGKVLDLNEQQLKAEFLVPKGEMDDFAKPYTMAVQQRVAVPRGGSGDAEPFFFEWKYFTKDAGLFCLFQADEKHEQLVKELFVRLGENGIGSDRSVGGGMFDVEFDTIDLPEVNDANAMMLLSQYIPTEDELKQISLEDSCYELVQRGGYMSGSDHAGFRHLIKQSVYMFNTASVLKTPHSPVGRIVDLTPSWNGEEMHPVYRSGRSLALPIKITD